jgi:hypothetical protein
MYTITITDKDADGFLSVDLVDLLRALAPIPEDVEWCVANLELASSTTDELYDIERRNATLTISQLDRLAHECGQIINGEITACSSGTKTPVLVLRAVDSSAWDVSADDQEMLARVRRAFSQVREVGEVG